MSKKLDVSLATLDIPVDTLEGIYNILDDLDNYVMGLLDAPNKQLYKPFTKFLVLYLKNLVRMMESELSKK